MTSSHDAIGLDGYKLRGKSNVDGSDEIEILPLLMSGNI